MEQKEKILYLEIIRILAIFSVILLHCNAEYFSDGKIFETKTWWLSNTINAASRFGVPVFFMISGFVLLSTKTAENMTLFYKKRFLKIIPAFLAWNLIYYINHCFKQGTFFSVKEFITLFGTQNISYHFWFVYMILFFYLFTPFLKKVVNQCTQKQLWICFLIIIFPTTICPVLNRMLGKWFLYFPMTVEGYWGYFLMGYLLGNYQTPKKYRIILYCLAILCVPIAIIGTHNGSSFEKIDTFYRGGYQFNSFVIGAAIFLFFKYHMPVIKSTVLSKYIVMFGNLSFGLYLCHVLLIEKLHLFFDFSKTYVQIFVLTFLTFIIGYMIIFFIHKIKFLNKLLL